ncbi:MAG: hypothetical protein RQ741_06045 [Wenzhouxiangellaceae bacterium]|nr:hypothetical protein [Wenzhouxiangellaceae bacterium]
MIKRQFRALAAGVTIGVVAQESLWMGLNLIDPAVELNELLAAGSRPSAWILPMLICWIFGGLLGGLMATLVARNRIAGVVCGALLSGSAWLLATLSWPQPGAMILLTLVPLVAAIPATWLGSYLLNENSSNAAVCQDKAVATLGNNGMD